LLGPGDYVVIDVEDNGSGMSAEVRERIFEPFYTTKARGAGLGLSAVHGTMRSHGGAVAVRSREGEGSTLSLYLPVADCGAKTRDKTNDPMRTPQPRRLPPQLTVYFADDEPLVRKAVAAMLRVHGCQVTSFESGEQLLAALAEGKPPGVVMTDLAMPGMSGLRLVQALRTSHPQLPLLLVTGYTDDDLTEVFGGGAPPQLLRKPFGSSQLLAALSDVLELSRTGLSAVDLDESEEPRSGLISVSAHAISSESELTAKLDANRFSAPRRRRFS
jgi:FixJ family two-component response regulator